MGFILRTPLNKRTRNVTAGSCLLDFFLFCMEWSAQHDISSLANCAATPDTHEYPTVMSFVSDYFVRIQCSCATNSLDPGAACDNAYSAVPLLRLT